MAVEEQKGRKRLALNITTNPTKRKKTKAKKSDDRGAVLKPVEEDEDLQPDVPSLASKDRALATLEDIALALNSDVAAESSRGVAALLKCCQHAELELRAFAAKRLSFEPKLRREKAGELERSLVIFQYLHSSPEVAELLRLWEEARKVHNHRGCGDVMQLLAAILDVTVVPSLGHVVGHICKVVIRDKMKWIYGALSADTPRNGKGEPFFRGGWAGKHQCRSALRLLAACARSSPSAAQMVAKTFNFAYKPVTMLASMRGGSMSRATEKNDDNIIRTHFIRLALALVASGDMTAIQSAMTIRQILPATFRLLHLDSSSLLVDLVVTLQHHILMNMDLAHKAKTSFFGGFFLDQLATIYAARCGEEEPANAADAKLKVCLDRFLPELLCSSSCGIVYPDPDWSVYREKNAPIRNRALLRFALALQPTESEPQQRLVLKVLSTAPDIVAPYLASLPLAFDPRPSVSWLQNVRFLCKVVTLVPVPLSPSSSDANVLLGSPPVDIQVVSRSILPSAVISRAAISQGLQHKSPMVRSQTVVLVLSVFAKLRSSLRQMEEATGVEGPLLASPAWSQFRASILEDIRARLPDVQVVVKLYTLLTKEHVAEAKEPASDDQGDAVMAEATTPSVEEAATEGTGGLSDEELLQGVLQVIDCFQEFFPTSLVEARFDVVRLITSKFIDQEPAVQQHIVDILLRKPQSGWIGKVAGTKDTFLAYLLRCRLTTTCTRLQESLEALIHMALIELNAISADNSDVASSLPFVNAVVDADVSDFVRIVGATLNRQYHYLDRAAEILEEARTFVLPHTDLSEAVSLCTDKVCHPLLLCMVEEYASGRMATVQSQLLFQRIVCDLLVSGHSSPILLAVAYSRISLKRLHVDQEQTEDALVLYSRTKDDELVIHALHLVVRLVGSQVLKNTENGTLQVQVSVSEAAHPPSKARSAESLATAMAALSAGAGDLREYVLASPIERMETALLAALEGSTEHLRPIMVELRSIIVSAPYSIDAKVWSLMVGQCGVPLSWLVPQSWIGAAPRLQRVASTSTTEDSSLFVSALVTSLQQLSMVVLSSPSDKKSAKQVKKLIAAASTLVELVRTALGSTLGLTVLAECREAFAMSLTRTEALASTQLAALLLPAAVALCPTSSEAGPAFRLLLDQLGAFIVERLDAGEGNSIGEHHIELLQRWGGPCSCSSRLLTHLLSERSALLLKHEEQKDSHKKLLFQLLDSAIQALPEELSSFCDRFPALRSANGVAVYGAAQSPTMLSSEALRALVHLASCELEIQGCIAQDTGSFLLRSLLSCVARPVIGLGATDSSLKELFMALLTKAINRPPAANDETIVAMAAAILLFDEDSRVTLSDALISSKSSGKAQLLRLVPTKLSIRSIEIIVVLVHTCFAGQPMNKQPLAKWVDATLRERLTAVALRLCDDGSPAPWVLQAAFPVLVGTMEIAAADLTSEVLDCRLAALLRGRKSPLPLPALQYAECIVKTLDVRSAVRPGGEETYAQAFARYLAQSCAGWAARPKSELRDAALAGLLDMLVLRLDDLVSAINMETTRGYAIVERLSKALLGHCPRLPCAMHFLQLLMCATFGRDRNRATGESAMDIDEEIQPSAGGDDSSDDAGSNSSGDDSGSDSSSSDSSSSSSDGSSNGDNSSDDSSDSNSDSSSSSSDDNSDDKASTGDEKSAESSGSAAKIKRQAIDWEKDGVELSPAQLVVVTNVYTTLWQGPQVAILATSDGELKAKLLELLGAVLCLLQCKPCTPYQHKFLLGCYGATLLPADRALLKVLVLLETVGYSITAVNYLWGNALRLADAEFFTAFHSQALASYHPSLARSVHSAGVGVSISNGSLFDTTTLNKSAGEFPVLLDFTAAPMAAASFLEVSEDGEQPLPVDSLACYDPRFVLPLLVQVITLHAVDHRQLVECGAVSFAVRSLASKYPGIRQQGYYFLSQFYLQIKDAKFHEKLQVHVILTLLRNSFSITQENQCLSAVTTAFFSRAVQTVLHPDHPVFGPLNKFVLRKPDLDLTEVPMLLDLIMPSSSESSSNNSMRHWLLENLQQGMCRYLDMKVFKRRNTMAVLLDTYSHCHLSDKTSCRLIVSLLRKGIRNIRIAVDLADKQGLVAWVAMHLCFPEPNRTGALPVSASVPLVALCEELAERLPFRYLKQSAMLDELVTMCVGIIREPRCTDLELAGAGTSRDLYDATTRLLAVVTRKCLQMREDLPVTCRLSPADLCRLLDWQATVGRDDSPCVAMALIVLMATPEALASHGATDCARLVRCVLAAASSPAVLFGEALVKMDLVQLPVVCQWLATVLALPKVRALRNAATAAALGLLHRASAAHPDAGPTREAVSESISLWMR